MPGTAGRGTVFRLDTRTPAADGWSGRGFMAPNPNGFASASPQRHQTLTNTYVSGSDDRNVNTLLGCHRHFLQRPFLCLSRTTNGVFSMAPCCGSPEFLVRRHTQCRATHQAIFRADRALLGAEVYGLGILPDAMATLISVTGKPTSTSLDLQRDCEWSLTPNVPIVYR